MDSQKHKPTTEPTRLPTHRLREIAVAAQADPRTVARVLRGEHVRGQVADRIAQALARMQEART